MRHHIQKITGKIHIRSVAGLCALADGITTKFALSTGAGIESNWLAPTSITGIMLATAIKLAFTQYAGELLGIRRAYFALTLCIAIWGAAAANNLFIVLNAPPISSLLASLGVVLLTAHFFIPNTTLQKMMQKSNSASEKMDARSR